MVIQFTIQEFMYFLVGVLGVAAGILLLSILWHLQKAIRVVRTLIDTSQEDIGKTISTMPGIFTNVEQISSDVRETTDKLKISVPAILHEVEGVTNVSKVNIELAGEVMEKASLGITETITKINDDIPDFVGYLHIFEEVLQILYRTFLTKK